MFGRRHHLEALALESAPQVGAAELAGSRRLGLGELVEDLRLNKASPPGSLVSESHPSADRRPGAVEGEPRGTRENLQVRERLATGAREAKRGTSKPAPLTPQRLSIELENDLCVLGGEQ